MKVDRMVAETFSADVLKTDPAVMAGEIQSHLQQVLPGVLKKRGVVVGISGGIDSSVVAALAVRALSPSRVFGLLMPEADSSPESTELGRLLAEQLGIRYAVEDISPALAALGCYSRRDEAIRKLVPGYGAGWKCKIVLPNLLQGNQYSFFSLVVESPAGERSTVRLDLDTYLTIVAATNFKQRTRKMLEYYHADRLNFAVAGTPNRLEYDQGFFVKNGDGAADVKPIAHLYKTQVYHLAEYLGVPEVIRQRPSTTDTYSLEQSQEEFYFAVPYDKMDLCLYGKNHGMAAAEVAPACGLTEAQVERVYGLIDSKRASTRYLHQSPLLVQSVLQGSVQE
jgi:NAD+ synthase